MMNWYELNFAFGSVFFLSAGLFVLYGGESRRITQQTWFLLCLFTSIWYAGRFLMAIAETETQAERAVYVIYTGAIFVPPSFLHFVLSLLNQEKERRHFQIFWYLFAFVEVALLASGQLTLGVRRYPDLGFYEIPSGIYLVFFLYFISLPAIGIIGLVKAYRQTELPNRRNQLKYVIYASLIGFLGGGISFLPFVDANVPLFGVPLSICFTFIITYAIARYRLMDINIVFKKSLVYSFVLLMLLIPCYLLVIWGQKVAFGSIDYSFSLFTLVLFIAVGFLFPKFRFKTEEALERVLFKKRYDHRETLLRSSKDMVSMVNLEAISNSTVHTVGKALGVEKASLFLFDEVKGSFDLKTNIGLNLDQFQESALLREDPLVQRLMERPEGLVREEIEMARDGPDGKLIAERMGQIGAEVTLPLMSKKKLIGILNLGHKEDKEMYSYEDLEVLSTLANQAAIALENARLYENLKQSQSIIRRADRLSSLGMLTAGLAHEIRNPLVAIRTFTQLLPERYGDVEFRNNFQAVALKEVDRICGLVNDLLSFARPSVPNVSAENVNEIVDSIARILDTEAKEKDVRIHLRLDRNLPNIMIDKEQIKQVLMNFILNAIQAIESGGVVDLTTRLFAKNGSEQFVEVGVRDSGVGIAGKDLENIFNPFFTTKKEGSGLGLSISHQIVQEHGGYIVVESNLGEGSTFFINLPVRPLSREGMKAQPQVHEKSSDY